MRIAGQGFAWSPQSGGPREAGCAHLALCRPRCRSCLLPFRLTSVQVSYLILLAFSLLLCWQALLEFHAFPAVPVTALVGGGRAASGGAGAAGQTLGAALRLWGAFWQSGAARVGEEGGEGWAAWYR